MLNEAHAPERQRAMPIRVLLARMRHDGCGGRAGRVELLTGVDGVSSRPVRRIVLRAGWSHRRTWERQGRRMMQVRATPTILARTANFAKQHTGNTGVRGAYIALPRCVVDVSVLTGRPSKIGNAACRARGLLRAYHTATVMIAEPRAKGRRRGQQTRRLSGR
jgi:hypothetical protein